MIPASVMRKLAFEFDGEKASCYSPRVPRGDPPAAVRQSLWPLRGNEYVRVFPATTRRSPLHFIFSRRGDIWFLHQDRCWDPAPSLFDRNPIRSTAADYPDRNKPGSSRGEIFTSVLLIHQAGLLRLYAFRRTSVYAAFAIYWIAAALQPTHKFSAETSVYRKARLARSVWLP